MLQVFSALISITQSLHEQHVNLPYSVNSDSVHALRKKLAAETLWLLLSHNPFSLISADFSLIFLGLFLEGGIIQIQGGNRFSTFRHLRGSLEGERDKSEQSVHMASEVFLPDVSVSVERTSQTFEVISPPGLLIFLWVVHVWRWLKSVEPKLPAGHPRSPLIWGLHW